METAEAVASSAVKTAIDINAKMLVVLTETGNTARLVAKYRPEMPVLTGKDLGWLKKGDAVVAVHGIQEAKSASRIC
ncbi:hypothetical protein PC114_g12359 [Phytophthora cactorum]|nr:hypothetical protein PC114_g12359 [Phytophthora cactorum]KAG3017629.1 hypothetical protein PC120_g10922 [Phytophthora cactorum]